MASFESLQISPVKLSKDHIDISSCLESSEKPVIDSNDSDKYKFTCEGRTANKLYYTLAYKNQESKEVRSVGINPKSTVQVISKTSDLRCTSQVDKVVNGVIKKKFKCVIELTGSKDALAVSGRYKHSIFNGNYMDHTNYISDQFDEKSAILRLSLDDNGELNIDQNPDTKCRPLGSTYNKKSLRYKCSVTTGEDSILLYQPKI